MSFARYLKDHWVILLIAACVSAVCVLVLRVAGVNISFAIFIVVLLMVALAGALVYDYLRRKRFYDEFVAVCADIDRKQLLTEVLPRPDFLEGQVAFDALKEASKSMNDEIAAYRQSSEEYRDYIETWVHEIKTPIAAALLAASNDRTPTTKRIAAELNRIEDDVEQALYFARSTTLSNDYLIREVRLEDIVKDAVRDHARVLIDAGVQPSFHNLDRTVFADSKWCVFVLGQLIDNAAKYRKPSGTTDGAHLTFSASASGEGTADERVMLSVEDDGIGMPESDVSRAFERGFTGENGRRFARSTGMGLYLCQRLCRKMGLSITLTSEQGKGTCVMISFPINEMYLPR